MLDLDPPADEAQLLLACEQLRRRRWGRSRPPWEMWFLPGLPAGRVGFFIKVHHAIADGDQGRDCWTRLRGLRDPSAVAEFGSD